MSGRRSRVLTGILGAGWLVVMELEPAAARSLTPRTTPSWRPHQTAGGSPRPLGGTTRRLIDRGRWPPICVPRLRCRRDDHEFVDVDAGLPGRAQDPDLERGHPGRVRRPRPPELHAIAVTRPAMSRRLELARRTWGPGALPAW